jgi:hypothetical protein
MGSASKISLPILTVHELAAVAEEMKFRPQSIRSLEGC